MTHRSLLEQIQDLRMDLDASLNQPQPNISPDLFLDAAHLLALSMNLYYAALLKSQHTSLQERANRAEAELQRLKTAIHAAMGIPVEHLQTLEIVVPEVPETIEAVLQQEEEQVEEEQVEEEEEIKLPEEVRNRWGVKEYAVHAYLLLNKPQVSLREIIDKMQEQGWHSNAEKPLQSVYTVLIRANSPLIQLYRGAWTLKKERDRYPESAPEEEAPEEEQPKEEGPERAIKRNPGQFTTASIRPNDIREGPLQGLSATSKVECALCHRREWVHKAHREGWPAPDRCPDHEEKAMWSTPPDTSWLRTVQLPISEDARRAEAERQEEKLGDEEEPDPAHPNPFSRKRPTARGNAQGWREKRQQQYRHKHPWKKPT